VTDTDTDATVLLARHGETAWNREGRIQGWAPVSITDRGREQARTLGRHLASTHDVDHLVASDLRRTRETTLHLREAGLDPEPVFSRAWRERDVGVFQGLSREVVFEDHPEYGVGSGTLAARATPEGGESLLDLHERVLDGWQQLLDRTADRDGETVLVVTHGGPIYVLLSHLKRLSLPAGMTAHSQDNCAFTELSVGGEAPEDVRILRENERP
jgi:probable phosphoglycerate mutase